MSKLTNAFKVHGCRVLHSEDTQAARVEFPGGGSEEFTSAPVERDSEGVATAGEPTAVMQAIKAARAFKADAQERERQERLAKIKAVADDRQQSLAAPVPKRKGK